MSNNRSVKIYFDENIIHDLYLNNNRYLINIVVF